MPRSLHAKLAELAERDGVSLNSLITSTLESAVNRREHRVSAGEAPPRGSADTGRRPPSRFLEAALVVNFLVVALAAAIAIGLLVAAWRHGW